MTNLVSEVIFYTKRVGFDNYKIDLYLKKKTIGYVEHYNRHYLFENHVTTPQPEERSAAFATPTKTATMNDRHQILGHAPHGPVSHLENSAGGVIVSDADGQVLKINECQTCALSKAHQIVSQSSN